jgi:hypothetical protein
VCRQHERCPTLGFKQQSLTYTRALASGGHGLSLREVDFEYHKKTPKVRNEANSLVRFNKIWIKWCVWAAHTWTHLECQEQKWCPTLGDQREWPRCPPHSAHPSTAHQPGKDNRKRLLVSFTTLSVHTLPLPTGLMKDNRKLVSEFYHPHSAHPSTAHRPDRRQQETIEWILPPS